MKKSPSPTAAKPRGRLRKASEAHDDDTADADCADVFQARAESDGESEQGTNARRCGLSRGLSLGDSIIIFQSIL